MKSSVLFLLLFFLGASMSAEEEKESPLILAELESVKVYSTRKDYEDGENGWFLKESLFRKVVECVNQQPLDIEVPFDKTWNEGLSCYIEIVCGENVFFMHIVSASPESFVTLSKLEKRKDLESFQLIKMFVSNELHKIMLRPRKEKKGKEEKGKADGVSSIR